MALTIVTLTMTVGMSLLAQQSDITRRLRAHQEAMRAIETSLEGIRAGVVPLVNGPVGLAAGPTEAEALVVWLDVTPAAKPPGLAEVVVEARYAVGTQTLTRSVKTMVWGSP